MAGALAVAAYARNSLEDEFLAAIKKHYAKDIAQFNKMGYEVTIELPSDGFMTYYFILKDDRMKKQEEKGSCVIL